MGAFSFGKEMECFVAMKMKIEKSLGRRHPDHSRLWQEATKEKIPWISWLTELLTLEGEDRFC
jgi:hypothetical protein